MKLLWMNIEVSLCTTWTHKLNWSRLLNVMSWFYCLAVCLEFVGFDVDLFYYQPVRLKTKTFISRLVWFRLSFMVIQLHVLCVFSSWSPLPELVYMCAYLLVTWLKSYSNVLMFDLLMYLNSLPQKSRFIDHSKKKKQEES